MRNYSILFLLIIPILLNSCKLDRSEKEVEIEDKLIAILTSPITIDGIMDEGWKKAKWHPIDQVWLGKNLTPQDFSGEYKIMYDKNYLYILANITDDKLAEFHEDGLDRYWDDDCLEIFVDEDRSMGNHQYNHNAFAYHIALDKKVIDIGLDSVPRYYNNHVKTARKSAGMRHLWEAAISIYDDTYVDGGQNQAVKLTAGKTMGFAIAYCDNDNSKEREHFIGSTKIGGNDKNRGWIDAGVFEELKLK